MSCLATPRGVLKKKRPCKSRIQRSRTDYNLYWCEARGWVSWVERPLLSAPSPHLHDSCPIAVVSVLRHYLKQASWWRFIHCEHWKHENNVSWAVGWWQRGHKVKVRGTAGRLGRNRAGAIVQKSSIHSESYPPRADKQALRQLFYRPLWRKEDLGAGSHEVLLATTTTRSWVLRQGLRRLFGFKGSLL